MATLTALKFPTADGADTMLRTIRSLQKQQRITIHDAAILTWPAGKKKPKTRQLHNLAGAGALTGAFWGMLFGLLFFIPFLGLAIGAGMGALFGALADIGIDDDFIKQVRSQVTEGTSALFLMTSGAVAERVREAVKGQEFKIIATNHSKEQKACDRSAFSEEA